MSTNTTNYDFILPAVNSPTDEDLWGDELNDNFTSLDSLLFTATNWVKREVTGTDTATIDDRNKIILGDATVASYAQTLPSAATVEDGFTISFVKTDSTSHTITLTRVGSDNIGGSNTYVISTQNDGVTLTSDGVDTWNFQSKVNVPYATSGETLTGSETSKAITPAGFAGNKNLSADGYYKFPGGFIEQWGLSTPSSYVEGISNTVTFSIEFPTACFGVLMQHQMTSPLGDNSNTVVVLKQPPDTDEFIYFFDQVDGTPSGKVYWRAWGH